MAQGSSQNAVVTGSGTIVAARTGYRIRVLGYVLTAAMGDASAQWADDSTSPVTLLSGQMELREGIPAVAPTSAPTEQSLGGWFVTAASANLLLQATGNVTGHVSYCYEAG